LADRSGIYFEIVSIDAGGISRDFFAVSRLSQIDLLIFGDWVEPFNPVASHHLGERSRPVVMVPLHNPGLRDCLKTGE
jgi:hypothetical protein